MRMSKKLKITNTGKVMEFPISVGELDIPDKALNMNYGGYIYLIELLMDYIIDGVLFKKGTWYIGSAFEPICFHKKLGIYFQSSKNKFFKMIWYGKSAGILKFSVIKILPKEYSNNDIRMKERQMYQQKLVKNSNTWNGQVIASKSINTELNIRLVKYVKRVVKIFMGDKEKFKNYNKKGIFYFTNEEYSFLHNLTKLQTKSKEQSRTERNKIIQLLNKSNSYDKLEPSIVLKDFFGPGMHLLIDGNTTIIIMGEKDIPSNYVLWLEKDFYSRYNIVELFQAEIFGNQYNRDEDTNPTIKVFTNPESAAQSLISAWYGLEWDKSYDYTELDKISNVNEILHSFNLLPLAYNEAIKIAKRRIKKKGKQALNTTRPDWSSDNMQPKLVLKINESLEENNFSKQDTLVVIINAKGMENAYTRLGVEAIPHAKKGEMKVWGEKTLKNGQIRKAWVYEKVKGFNFKNIENILFMVNCGQDENAQIAFEESSTDDNGNKIESHWNNFKESLNNIGNTKKLKYKILPIWASNLKNKG